MFGNPGGKSKSTREEAERNAVKDSCSPEIRVSENRDKEVDNFQRKDQGRIFMSLVMDYTLVWC